MPIRDATMPIANIRPSGCLGPGGGLSSGLETDTARDLIRRGGRKQPRSAGPWRLERRGDAAVAGRFAAGAAEARRRRTVVAPERLGELRGLAVADAVGDLAHRQPPIPQKVEGLAHAHARYMRAEARAADLGEGALQLPARGGEAARDVV